MRLYYIQDINSHIHQQSFVVLRPTLELRNDGIIYDSDWRKKSGHFTVYLKSPAMFNLYEQSRIHDEFFSRAFCQEIEEILESQPEKDRTGQLPEEA